MKYKTQNTISIIVLFIAVGCKKFKEGPTPLSSLTIVNAVVGSSSIITDFDNINPISTYYSTSARINYGGYLLFSRPSGENSFVAFQTVDTINAIYKKDKHNGLLDLKPQGIYSLFLCGQVTPTLQTDAFVIKDELAYHPATDSSMGVRFVNLSPGSNPVSVTLSTSNTVKEIENIAYKNVSIFKTYSVNASASSSYVFEFRDAGTNTVLGTYTFSGIRNGTNGNTSTNQYRFRNFTLVFRGLPGGTGANAQGVFIVNNY